MRRVGLTGNIASGKSSVSAVWRRLGAHVIDADELARRAVEPGTPGLARIVERFGEGVLGADGLDRGALRALVFADPAERAALEAIVHPAVARLREVEEARLAAGGATLVVHEIPLLFEAGLAPLFDTVVLVDAPEGERLRRLVDRRGVASDEAKRMMAAQLPAAQKRAQADIVIGNSGTLEALEAEAAAVWRRISEGRA
jgi:dephospho-CoA kinase